MMGVTGVLSRISELQTQLGITPAAQQSTVNGTSFAASLASATGGAEARGYLLIAVYCLGLGLPFLLIALGARWAVRATDWVRRHGRQVQIFGGVLLMIVGILLVTGVWGDLMGWLRNELTGEVKLPL